MKKIRLLVVAPTAQQVEMSSANTTEADKAIIRENMTLKYKAMIQAALRTPLNKDGGVGIEEMERSLDVLKKVDIVEDNGVLEMDDADFDYLTQKIGAVRWMGFDERIIEFVHTIKNATKDLLDEPVDDEVDNEPTSIKRNKSKRSG